MTRKTPRIGFEGPVQSVFDLSQATAQLGHRVLVLTTNANGPTSTLDVDVRHEVELAARLTVRYYPRLGHHSAAPGLVGGLLAAVTNADVVHLTAVYSFPTLPTLAICRLLDRPLIWSPRGSLQRWAGSTRVRAKAVWEQACRCLAPRRLVLHLTSEDEAAASRQRFPSAQVCVVPNGVATPAMLPKPATNGDLRLVYLGRLHPIKAIDHLIDACQLLSASGDVPWTLMVAGDGEPGYVRELAARAKAANLGDRVHFIGHVSGERKRTVLANADVLVLPSHVENFGMVVAEALAQGVPVIASRGAPWRRLEEVGCGVWVDNSPPSLADAIRHMRRQSLAAMGEIGRAWMEREFSWPAIATRMVEVYTAAIRAAPRRDERP